MLGELRNSAEENFGKLEKDGVGVLQSEGLIRAYRNVMKEFILMTIPDLDALLKQAIMKE